MQDEISIGSVIKELKSEMISTWFDLGIFLDRIKENRKIPCNRRFKDIREFHLYFKGKGVAFLTFHYSVDGVTVEVSKYSELVKRNLPGSEIHYISGIFKPEGEKLIPAFVKKHQIEELQGFDEWKFYRKFYFTHMERGGEEYNSLIKEFWEESLKIVEKLGAYIQENDIELLYLVNVNSNPGNVCFALATVLISEYLGIPVINNNHDFYWEGGSFSGLLSSKKKDKGPRDFFFRNAHLGEFFSIIEMLFPWESPRWIHVNINKEQTEYLVSKKGINPANILEIGTAVDTEIYKNIDKRKKIDAFFQFQKILSRYKEKLIVYSVDDVISNNLVDPLNPMPILIGSKTRPFNKFIAENIIFLQPTRIISRKRIEVAFRLLVKMLEKKEFRERMEKTRNLKITILVTGPIASGQYEYFIKLLGRFQNLLGEMRGALKEKIFLAFLFSELDKESFKNRFDSPSGIPELYNIASLVLLPSKTEGRGLPIIESTACGTPIFVRQYAPRNVYEEVIGTHLPEANRLKVIEYDGKNIKRKDVELIIERVLFPHKFTGEVNHNRTAVLRRFSLEALNNNLKDVLYRVFVQCQAGIRERQKIISELQQYRKSFHYEDENLRSILNNENRQYIAGYGKLSFMLYLKSLIDPSYFRIEQMEVKGNAFLFAREIMRKDPEQEFISQNKKIDFYNMVEAIFNYHDGEMTIRHDHSMSYRHRNNNYYPYQDYTFQELTGLINQVYLNIVEPSAISYVAETPHFFTDWNLALLQLTGSSSLEIDDRKILIRKLKENIPLAYFPGEHLLHELDLFILQPVRSRLNLGIEQVITDSLLKEQSKGLARMYLFTQEKHMTNHLSSDEMAEYILKGDNEELRLLYQYNVLKIVPTDQWTVGIHFAQLGRKALLVLRQIREEKGFIITSRKNAILMTDIIDLDRFHIGKVRSALAEGMIGIPLGSGFIQFAPAGIRTVLSYPVPVQTAKDFNMVLKSQIFRQLKNALGEENIFGALRKDALMYGSTAKQVLDKLDNPTFTQNNSTLQYRFLMGTYNDGHAYNGVIAKINLKKQSWEFHVAVSSGKPVTVNEFSRMYQKKTGCPVRLAWNGGYILNPELVGKLGLGEAYIGSPLGLIISDNKILCPPLFNKPALIINKKGEPDIRRVNSSSGFSVLLGGKEFCFESSGYNLKNSERDLCFYDLLYEEEFIYATEKTVIHLAGNIIKEIIETNSPHQKIKKIPVGLSLCFNKKIFPSGVKTGDEVEFMMKEFRDITHAIEAGPMLLDNGSISIHMENEGWKHFNSIKTQAARLDYTDMRGPKIAAGIDGGGNLVLLAVNGRIRESVGATHAEIAQILKDEGMYKAMGFDPGGSSTLFVDGKVRNISPYNHNYEKNVYTATPEPRAVSSAILGILKED
jgi:glycosyltransferase involved in cell wall biosynthesis